MRIVQLANFYGPASGGLRTFVDEVGRRYGEHGHERVLVVPGPVDADEATPAGRRISLRGPALPVARGYRAIGSRRALLALLGELRPDALEVNDRLLLRWTSRWARERGLPAVLFAHERLDVALRDWVPAALPLPAAADAVNRRLLPYADEVVVGSAFAAGELRRIGGDPRVVPLGVDLDLFRPAPARPVGRVVKLVQVGRLSREKRPAVALDALRLLLARGLRAELTVLGAGPLRAPLERAAAGLPVRFLGHVADRRSLAAVIAAADVTVAPSPMETFGLAVLESLACGTPVVVPTVGAAHELVAGPGTGVVTDGTAARIADGVLSVLDVPGRRAAARARAEQFPWSRTVAGMLSVLNAVDTRAIIPA